MSDAGAKFLLRVYKVDIVQIEFSQSFIVDSPVNRLLFQDGGGDGGYLGGAAHCR
jgi:hypothetical protein